jgi:hypothetical protein
MTLVPLPSRDYTSKAQVMEAWNTNKDFHTADIMSGYGHATNKADLERMGKSHGVSIRYARQTKVIYIS